MKKTKAKRKLLSEDNLNWLQDRLDLGVPLARAIRDKKLAISNPAVSTLLEWYAVYTVNPETFTAVYDSLFPAWLDQSDNMVQSNPSNWIYAGRFPWGYWIYDDKNN